MNAIETEEHFLTSCTFFNRYKPKYGLQNIDNAKNLMLNTEQTTLSIYLREAFSERKKFKDWFSLD